VVSGALRELLGAGKRRSEVTIGGASEALREALKGMGAEATRAVAGDLLVMEVDGEEHVKAVVERVLAEGARLEGVTTKRETLEDLFVRRAL
jgi:ABC-2 type transport system ATP-binding protein